MSTVELFRREVTVAQVASQMLEARQMNFFMRFETIWTKIRAIANVTNEHFRFRMTPFVILKFSF